MSARLTTFIKDLKSVANVSAAEILGPENVALVTIDMGASYNQATYHVVDSGDKFEMDLLGRDGDIVKTVELSSGKEFNPSLFKTVKEAAADVVNKVLAEDSDDDDGDAMEEFTDDCVDNVDEISDRSRYIQHMQDILTARVMAKLKVSRKQAKEKIEDLALSVWDLYHDR
jgi:hypothetical protein